MGFMILSLGKVMKVWLDVLTPKQAFLASCIIKSMESLGYSAVVTARDYDFTLSVLERNGITATVVGRYGGNALYGKLMADIKRMAKLAGIIAKERPDALVCYPNPAAARVAFGLGIKTIILSDSPHSQPASRLSIPLADVLVHSEFIPREKFRIYVLTSFTKVVTYRGVDEVAWLKGFKPATAVLKELGLEPLSYIVIRPEESMAAYYRWLSLIHI